MTKLNVKSISIFPFNRGYEVKIELADSLINYQKLIPEMNLKHIIDHTREMQYGFHENGVVSFGMWYYDEKKRPGHGGCWSSRSGVANPMLGLQLVDIALENMATHMTKDALEDLFREFGVSQHYTIKPEYDGAEVRYEVRPITPDAPTTFHSTKGLDTGNSWKVVSVTSSEVEEETVWTEEYVLDLFEQARDTDGDR